MSGIYGIYRYDGAPVDAHCLQLMKAAMSFYGPDGESSAISGPVGMGHLLLAINPEDTFGKQPMPVERGFVVANARLDNRDELLEAFGISAQEASQVADSHLAGLAFERWGEAVPSHLQGDWALAGWDQHSHRFLLARDACGNVALYFHAGRGFLAFASSIKALWALPDVAKEPDYFQLAQTLVCWSDEPERTAYKGFQRLMGGQAMSVDAAGQHRIWRYWSAEGREPLKYRRDDDYVEEFLALYTRAVRNSLRSTKPIASTLSAGRDSGSVTNLAASILAGEQRSLTAYTSVPLLPPDGADARRLGNEWELAHATAVMAGPNVRHRAIDAANYGVLQGVEYLLDLHGGPGLAAANAYWLHAIMDAVAEDGNGVLLTGEMGNATVSWEGNGVALLALLQGSPRSALRLLLHAAPNPWLSFRRQFVKPFLMPALRAWRRRHMPSGNPWREYSALNPDLAVELKLDDHMRAAGYDPTFTPSLFEDLRQQFFAPAMEIGHGLQSEISAWHSFSQQDPTANLRLLEFLLRVPDDQFRRGDHGSWLLRRAFAGRMPDPVLNSRCKGYQAADIGHRIVHELPAFQECLSALDSLPEARYALDMPLLHRCLDDLCRSVDPETTGKAIMILLRGIEAGLFLYRWARPTATTFAPVC